MGTQLKSRIRSISAAGLLMALTIVSASATDHIFSTGPSAFCHVTDGQFTDCVPGDPGGIVEEWSDISSLAGVGTSAGAIVYTDQSLAPPRLLLMYDLLQHNAPLAVDSFFDITFHVVEDGNLEVYTVQCFGDNTFRVFEDGVDITAEADTVDCKVGFGGNPPGNVRVELEIDTLVTYSPDIPLFWSTSAPRPEGPPPPCPQPGDPRCDGTQGALNANARVPTSSSIIIASSDGKTHVAGVPVGGVTPEEFCDKATGGGILVGLLGMQPGRNHGQFMKRVSHQAKMALDSLVGFGVVEKKDAGRLHGCIVSALAKK